MTGRITAAALLSLLAFVASRIPATRDQIPYSDRMMAASVYMEEAIHALTEDNVRNGRELDVTIDPNETSLIGPEITELMTSVGHLEAKRTTTNPDVAALLVYLLEKAGVSRGDSFAIGSSASFPALLVATLSAAQAMGADPIVIISLGASSHGATDPNYSLLDIYNILLELHIFNMRPAAASLGGANDIGGEFDPVLREKLIQKLDSEKIRLVQESDLRKNVETRMQIYRERSTGIAAFVNIGGSFANLGNSNLVLEIEPGLNENLELPAEANRGVLFEMASLNTPIIHLLNIKGLTERYGLPWDPIPLPAPGSSKLSNPPSEESGFFLITAVIYFLLLVGIFIFPSKT